MPDHELAGPYETHPQNPLLTAIDGPDLPLQKCGHGGFVEATCSQSLRQPIGPDWADTTSRPGWLRLHGGESLASLFRQSLLGRRVTAKQCAFTATLAMDPADDQHAAGMLAYYNTRTWFYLRLTRDADGVVRLGCESMDDGQYDEDTAAAVIIEGGSVQLRMEIWEPELLYSGAPPKTTSGNP